VKRPRTYRKKKTRRRTRQSGGSPARRHPSKPVNSWSRSRIQQSANTEWDKIQAEKEAAVTAKAEAQQRAAEHSAKLLSNPFPSGWKPKGFSGTPR
jgi:hypothetical protein